MAKLELQRKVEVIQKALTETEESLVGQRGAHIDAIKVMLPIHKDIVEVLKELVDDK